MSVILRAENLVKNYDLGETKVQAIRGIDLEIEENTFYSIVGKSGSGKSTLLHVLSGFDKPTEGLVFFEGKNIYKMKSRELAEIHRKKIGFVFQSYHLLPEFCAEENIKMPLYLDNTTDYQSYVEELMEKLGIVDLRLKFPCQMSGGEQQRVAIARALVAKPKIIFADEPTGNLDGKSAHEVLELLQCVQEEFGQSILLVTHDLEIAGKADKIIHIQDGILV